MSLLNRRVIYPTLTSVPETVYKKGSLGVVKYLPGDNVLILSSKTVSKTEPFEKMINKSLSKKKLKLEIIQNSFQDKIIEIKERYQSWPPDSIIAIGGGAVLDSAKVIRHLLSFPEDTIQVLSKKFTNITPKVNLVSVPTTPNTGSEVNNIAVIKDSDNHKVPLVNKTFLPNLSVLDPSLLATIPIELMKDFVSDIFAHAFEGSRSRLSNSFLQSKAIESIKLLETSLPAFIENKEDFDALENILFSGNSAGIVAGNAFVGIIHALAHGLESILNFSHAHAIRSLLPKTLTWIQSNTEDHKFNFDLYVNALQDLDISSKDKFPEIKNLDPDLWSTSALNDPSIKTDPIKFKSEEMLNIIKWIQSS